MNKTYSKAYLYSLQKTSNYNLIKLFTTQSRLFTILKKKAFKNIVEKGENAGNHHYFLFQQCYLPFQELISSFESHLLCHLQMLLIWTSLKMCCLVNKLSCSYNVSAANIRCIKPLKE